MVRKIVLYPNAILREKTIPVAQINEEMLALVDDMIETMLEKDGIGLAANQVGSRHRIFVLNTTPHDETPSPVVFVNPAILGTDGEMKEEEGCLSFPGLYLHIPRSRIVRVRAKSLYNEDLVYDAQELLARAIQHEIDHLDGVVFIDRAVPEEQTTVQEYFEQRSKEAS
ncbi:MAG: peptide deformylase [candidate division WOR-3 bacterium]|nr:MAG: peptide deformylase [candidate division WOR-3 bacterium]